MAAVIVRMEQDNVPDDIRLWSVVQQLSGLPWQDKRHGASEAYRGRVEENLQAKRKTGEHQLWRVPGTGRPAVPYQRQVQGAAVLPSQGVQQLCPV